MTRVLVEIRRLQCLKTRRWRFWNEAATEIHHRIVEEGREEGRLPVDGIGENLAQACRPLWQLPDKNSVAGLLSVVSV